MTAIRDAFLVQSGACADLGSRFMARLMALVADRLTHGTAVADRVLSWPGDVTPSGQSVPLRLAGALHAVKLTGDAGLAAVYPPRETGDDALWAAVETAFVTHEAFLLDRLISPPQTNEVRRSAVLIPALNLLAARHGLPMDLVEAGCSAGLNLRADRFRLDVGGQVYGDPESAVRLRPGWTGPAPAPCPPDIVRRIGIDIQPLDPVADEIRLLSYLWPDQPDRIALTRAAVRIAAETPATIVAGDARSWIEAKLRTVPGRLTVLYHTIAWQYLPEAARAAGDAAIARIGARTTPDAPLARFAMEAGTGGATLSLQLWPDGAKLALGRADYHGRWVEWAHEHGVEDPSHEG